MTPSDLPALARVLDALVPYRTVGQRADDPQEAHAWVERLETAGLTADVPARCARLGPACARWGAAPRPTGAPPVRPARSPSPFFGQVRRASGMEEYVNGNALPVTSSGLLGISFAVFPHFGEIV